MPKSAFLFPGQGAQTMGMAQQLCATLPRARALFDEAASILGYDLLAVCASGPKERLDSTAVSQPAIYVASLAALETLKASDPAAIDWTAPLVHYRDDRGDVADFDRLFQACLRRRGATGYGLVVCVHELADLCAHRTGATPGWL